MPKPPSMSRYRLPSASKRYAPSARTQVRSNPIVRSTRTNCGLIVRAQRSCSSPPAASRPLRSTAPTGGMYLRLRDCGANRELGALEANVDDVRRASQEREGGGVVARCECRDLRDAGSAGIGKQLGGERGADAAV